MNFVTFTYRNWRGQVRTVRAHHVADPAKAAAALSALLDTEVTWRAA